MRSLKGSKGGATTPPVQTEVKMREPAKEKEFQEDLDKLVLLGKKKGFLTYEEVNETLSDAIDSSEDIDQVFDILDGKDIKVVEAGEETSMIEETPA